MARLNVIAISEDTVASPDNANNLYIIISVTDRQGAGVTGLAIENLTLGTEIVGPGGSISHIDSVTNGNLPGTYLLQVMPLSGETWKAGVYIFSLNVTSGTDNGQTLCSVLMD
jgi:hypothetical protein